jgi:hypothetical protein
MLAAVVPDTGYRSRDTDRPNVMMLVFSTRGADSSTPLWSR